MNIITHSAWTDDHITMTLGRCLRWFVHLNPSSLTCEQISEPEREGAAGPPPGTKPERRPSTGVPSWSSTHTAPRGPESRKQKQRQRDCQGKEKQDINVVILFFPPPSLSLSHTHTHTPIQSYWWGKLLRAIHQHSFGVLSAGRLAKSPRGYFYHTGQILPMHTQTTGTQLPHSLSLSHTNTCMCMDAQALELTRRRAAFHPLCALSFRPLLVFVSSRRPLSLTS